MRRREPQNNLDHEHDWIPETMDVLWDESIFVTWECNWAEVTGSATSERLDETFYEYGAECAAQKRAVYRVAVVNSETDERAYTDVAVADTDVSFESERLFEQLWMDHGDELEQKVAELNIDTHYPGSHFTIDMDVLGDTFHIELELDKTYVEEDWK